MGTIVGLFETRDRASGAIEALRAAGFRSEDLGIALRDRRDLDPAAAEAGTGDATAEGVAVGGLLGGLTGALAAVGVLAIPGLGAVLIGGPLMAALAGAGVGVAAGGLLGALGGLGIPEDEALAYQEGLERGGILLTATVPDDRTTEARSILMTHGLRDIQHHRRLWEAGPAFRYDHEPESGVDRATLDEKAAGVLLGGTAGALAGGVAAGPIGAGLGAVVGSAAGGVVAAFDDTDYRRVEPEFRIEWERGPYRPSPTWDEASAAYQFGWDRAGLPGSQGRAWDDVAPELRTAWTGPGAWDDYAPLIRDAWDRRTARDRAAAVSKPGEDR